MGLRGLAIGVAAAALAATGCGSSKEPPPLTQVQESPSQTTTAPADAGAPASGSFHASVTNLGPRYNRVFAQLIDGRDALDNSADTVAAAASDAQGLANRVAGGYNPPSGSAPQVIALRDALSPFSEALHAMLTSSAQLPRLSSELQLRATQLAKRNPSSAAALLTTKQRIDAAIAELSGLDRAIVVVQGKVRDQMSRVSLNGDALDAAVTSATQTSAAAVAKVDDAVDKGLEALVGAA
jgi:hypothetical protein